MKPNYAYILIKTCREYVTAIKRTIAFEKLDLTDVQTYASKATFDVVLTTSDRIVAMRHEIGTKRVHIQEFQKDHWDTTTATANSVNEPINFKKFLGLYDQNVQKLEKHWLV